MDENFSNGFKVKDGIGMNGNVEKQGVGPKFHVWSNCAIPMTADGFERKNMSVVLTVINCVKEGFASVPYENVNGKTKVSTNAKPLSMKSKMEGEHELSKMTCWPFGIVDGCPKDKDARVEEEKWEVVPGMALRFTLWQEAARGGKADKFKESMDSPEHVVIPAFTVFEIELACKGYSKWEVGDVNENAKNKPRDICPVKKGYGLAITGMKPLMQSLYSFQNELCLTVPASASLSSEVQRKFEECNKPINQLISQQNVPFLVQVFNPETYVTHIPGSQTVQLSNWGDSGEDPIDITEENAIAYTNSNTIEDACRIIELGCMTNCIKIPCFYDQYRKGRDDSNTTSCFHGVPLIQTSKLLECIKPDESGGFLMDSTGNYYEFTPDYKVLGEGDMLVTPKIMVSKEPFIDVQGTCAAKMNDFCLVSVNVSIKKGYFIRIVRDDIICWGGFCNVSKPSFSTGIMNGEGASICRKRWAAEATATFDPFATRVVQQEPEESKKKKKSRTVDFVEA